MPQPAEIVEAAARADQTSLPAILAFLDRIGIPVMAEQLAEDGFLPGMAVRHGTIYLDPERPCFPGDLLHEAGHIAVTAPDERAARADVDGDPAEEMSAIAWSYAAGVEIGLDPAVIFHDHGYQGGGQWVIDAFTNGNYFGVPMLQLWGMTVDANNAAARGCAPYPQMLRWLR